MAKSYENSNGCSESFDELAVIVEDDSEVKLLADDDDTEDEDIDDETPYEEENDPEEDPDEDTPDGIDEPTDHIRYYLRSMSVDLDWDSIGELLDREDIPESFMKLFLYYGDSKFNVYNALYYSLRNMSGMFYFKNTNQLISVLNSAVPRNIVIPYIIVTMTHILYRYVFTYSMKYFLLFTAMTDYDIEDFASVIEKDCDGSVHRAIKVLVTVYDHIIFLIEKAAASEKHTDISSLVGPIASMITFVAAMAVYYFEYESLESEDNSESEEDSDEQNVDCRHWHKKKHYHCCVDWCSII